MGHLLPREAHDEGNASGPDSHANVITLDASSDDQKAFGILIDTLEPSQYRHIEGYTHVRIAYEALVAHHKPMTKIDRIQVAMEWAKLSWDPRQETLPDSSTAVKLLALMPWEFRHIVDRLSNLPDSEKTFANTKIALEAEWKAAVRGGTIKTPRGQANEYRALFAACGRGAPKEAVVADMAEVVARPEVAKPNEATVPWPRAPATPLAKKGTGMARATMSNDQRLYILDGVFTREAAHSDVVTDNTALCHHRIGHLPVEALRTCAKAGLGLPSRINDLSKPCMDCPRAKMHRVTVPKRSTRTYKPGECWHSDTKGPLTVASVGGCRYYTAYIDDCTGYKIVKFIHSTNAVDQATNLQEVLAFSERQTGNKTKVFRSDAAQNTRNQPYVL
ncbi:hypothetical protein DYB32_004759 [Aphanomyces invadans]|uniref:Integrase catalytic domain-containing protein n=1 Tax=Aphanomyces invadans TaxID=157072 RepID=A0A3R6Z4I1_9STRA|nr:hypothetical protein DYB32_004759 [Aphanomyces invadans]